MTWYTIQTRTQYENKVMEEIPKRLEAAGLTGSITEIFCPEELVETYKDGVRKESKKKKMPNYIFVDATYSTELWHTLKQIKGFSGFLGNKDRPTPVPDSQVLHLKEEVATSAPRPKVEYSVGATVLIKEGSFKDFNAQVVSADYEKSRLKVNITIFGRETQVDMDLADVELAA